MGSPFLLEEVEARAVFPLGAVHADAGCRNPVPTDAAVGGTYESDCQSTPHVPAGTSVRLLPLLCEVAGDAFKCRLRFDSENSIHQGDKGVKF